MLPVGWLVAAVVAAVLLSMWVTFTITRLDRLHARVDAARAALDAELVRRAAALVEAARSPSAQVPVESRLRYEQVAHHAMSGGPGPGAGAARAPVENAVGRAVADLALAGGDPHVLDDLREAAARVHVARRFYNDAVRDTRALRARRLPRLLHLAGHVPMPVFFDIDDTVPPSPAAPVTVPAPRPAPVADELPFDLPQSLSGRPRGA